MVEYKAKVINSVYGKEIWRNISFPTKERAMAYAIKLAEAYGGKPVVVEIKWPE